MTFTYNLSVPDDITRVRFHLADTNPDEAKFSDEEITFVISEAGSWQAAVIALLRNLIAKISATPDFQADWLRVSLPRALEGFDRLLSIKLNEFGLADTIVGAAKAVYRSDSLQTEAPEDW